MSLTFKNVYQLREIAVCTHKMKIKTRLLICHLCDRSQETHLCFLRSSLFH